MNESDPIMNDASALGERIYVKCTACMSVYADFLSWANRHHKRIVHNPGGADTIVLLGCQVTDLAIFNDLRALQWLCQWKAPARIFVGGCLAKRLDVPLGDDVERLDAVRHDCQWIEDTLLVDWSNPFWATNQIIETIPNAGSLFRNSYPLRIGVGCKGNCAFCTIKQTRGNAYTIPAARCEDEFKVHDNVVLIADNPTTQQLYEWFGLARKHNKPISLRNVEPIVAMRVWPDLVKLSREGLLPIFHCPVQSCNPDVIADMRRDVAATQFVIDELGARLRSNTLMATNIIVDYKDFSNRTDRVYETFDYVSWNPYWDNVWDEEKASRRWRRYFGA